MTSKQNVMNVPIEIDRSLFTLPVANNTLPPSLILVVLFNPKIRHTVEVNDFFDPTFDEKYRSPLNSPLVRRFEWRRRAAGHLLKNKYS